MSKASKGLQPKNDYQPAPDTSRSEEELRDKDLPNKPKESQDKKMTNAEKGGLLAFVTVAIVGLVAVAAGPDLDPEFAIMAQYEFKVFCPANKVINATLDVLLPDDDSFGKDG